MGGSAFILASDFGKPSPPPIQIQYSGPGSTISRTDNLDSANIHVIVHGQKELFEVVKSKLILKGFKEERIIKAKLDEAGNIGEYVAMAWPPGRPQEIIVNQIVDEKQARESTSAPGAWESVQQKELYRIPLM